MHPVLKGPLWSHLVARSFHGAGHLVLGTQQGPVGKACQDRGWVGAVRSRVPGYALSPHSSTVRKDVWTSDCKACPYQGLIHTKPTVPRVSEGGHDPEPTMAAVDPRPSVPCSELPKPPLDSF